MKRFYTVVLLVISMFAFGQTQNVSHQSEGKQSKFYTSAGGEWIFSFVEPDKDMETTSLRFQPWFHLQINWHYDFSKRVGGFFGIGSRNLGYTTNAKTNNFFTNDDITVYNETTQEFELSNSYAKDSDIETIKRRSYTISFPLGFKVGNLAKNRFLFFGGEIEFPFHYKNKVWVDGDKQQKYTEWFSDQTNPYMLSAFVGVQLPGGVNLKFKYYFDDLMNTDYTTSVRTTTGTAVKVKPFENLKSKIFYISFGMNMFSTTKAIEQVKSIDKKKKDSYSM